MGLTGIWGSVKGMWWKRQRWTCACSSAWALTGDEECGHHHPQPCATAHGVSPNQRPLESGFRWAIIQNSQLVTVSCVQLLLQVSILETNALCDMTRAYRLTKKVVLGSDLEMETAVWRWSWGERAGRGKRERDRRTGIMPVASQTPHLSLLPLLHAHTAWQTL